MRRCSVNGDREKRGWYSLHELALDDGGLILVGSFGVWCGNDNNAQKVAIDKSTRPTPEQSAALKTRMAEDQRRAAAQRKAENEKAARLAAKGWAACATDGESSYLKRKGVGAHGVRFGRHGELLIPLMDGAGKIHGLQVIYGEKGKRGRDKDFWPTGLAKKGHWFQIGMPDWIVLVAEGYATAASLHEATGLPVAVAFDANNILPVASALKKRYRRARVLICADDDYLQRCHAGEAGHKCGTYNLSSAKACRSCGKELKGHNTGISSASAAALAVDGAWLAPTFTDERPVDSKGHTDFNDLHLAEGLHVVRQQIEARITALKWQNKPPSAPVAGGGEGVKRRLGILDPGELLERFALVYGANSTVFDHEQRMLLSIGDVRDACADKNFVRDWQRNPEREIVLLKEVGFDPTESDKHISCNLWGGWPTSPKQGSCENLLDLLKYLCAGEDNPEKVYDWVLKWIAYPIQHPGAKMKTALVLHGPQGAGKNMFFEAVMAIYGEYGRIIDQGAVEDKFTDWASKKLFMIADEVVARAELFHMKNKLKGLITGETIRINPKNVTPYDEKNHVNLVFLSNETQPVVLERDDRRYIVIWTPPKVDQAFYSEVKREIDNGGVEALHHYLLNLDLGDFAPYTNPPDTKAKRDLIDISLDSTERFWNEWLADRLDGVPVMPCRSEDFYALYRAWANRNGITRFAPQPILLGNTGKRPGAVKKVAKYYQGAAPRSATFVFPPGHHAPPDGKTAPAWLGDCNETFSQSVTDWIASHGR